MQKKYAQQDQEAVEELARRHMIPMIQQNQQVRSKLRGQQQEASGPVMGLLSDTARMNRVPMDRRQELRQIERKYQNVDDERLLAKARKEGLGERGTQMMRRLIERGDNGADGDNPDTHQTHQKMASMKDVLAVLGGVDDSTMEG